MHKRKMATKKQIKDTAKDKSKEKSKKTENTKKDIKSKKTSQDKTKGKLSQKKEVNVLRELGRMSAGAYYQHQQTRIATFNQVRDILYRKMEGLNLTEIQEKKPEEQKYLEKYKDEYLNEYRRILNDEGKILSDENDYIKTVLDVQNQSKKYEKLYENLMNKYVQKELIYTDFLAKIRGISTILSANLIKEFGHCENAPYIGSLWAYCGMGNIVCPDCYEEIEDEESGDIKKYNLKLKTETCPHCGKRGIAEKRKKGRRLSFAVGRRMMVWKIGDSFVKQRTPFYRDIYDKEKERQMNLLKRSQNNKSSSVPNAPVSLLHADYRARRKAVKRFLAHYWMACKELYGEKNIPKPYVVDKLGHDPKHITDWKEAVEAQQKKKPDDVLKTNSKKVVKKSVKKGVKKSVKKGVKKTIKNDTKREKKRKIT